MINKAVTPNALNEIKGAVTRAPFFSGEPIRPTKVVKSSNSGFLSAILPSGSRAVAINIDAIRRVLDAAVHSKPIPASVNNPQEIFRLLIQILFSHRSILRNRPSTPDFSVCQVVIILPS